MVDGVVFEVVGHHLNAKKKKKRTKRRKKNKKKTEKTCLGDVASVVGNTDVSSRWCCCR